jgi:hypothetical protein
LFTYATFSAADALAGLRRRRFVSHRSLEGSTINGVKPFIGTVLGFLSLLHIVQTVAERYGTASEWGQ